MSENASRKSASDHGSSGVRENFDKQRDYDYQSDKGSYSLEVEKVQEKSNKMIQIEDL
jgi:hypothetical protein